jgi:hypothetical protein
MGLLKESLDAVIDGITNPLSVYTSAALLDASSTYCLMDMFGTECESNPITRYIVSNMGLVEGSVVKTAAEILIGISAYFAVKSFRKWKGWTFNLESGYLYYLAAWQAHGGILNTIDLYVISEYMSKHLT